MTNEEMQRTMEFIREMDARTTVTLQRLTRKVDAKAVAQNRSDKEWERTEKRIRALLARARIAERKIATLRRRRLPLRKTATDRRLKVLSDLVERQISERRNGKP